nr:hypothetical protein [Ruegeria arenilitoris]
MSQNVRDTVGKGSYPTGYRWYCGIPYTCLSRVVRCRLGCQPTWIGPIVWVTPSVRIEVQVTCGEADGISLDELPCCGIVVASAVVDKPGLEIVLAACVAVALLDGVDVLGLVAEGVVVVIGYDGAGGGRDCGQDRAETIGKEPIGRTGACIGGTGISLEGQRLIGAGPVQPAFGQRAVLKIERCVIGRGGVGAPRALDEGLLTLIL